MSYVLFLDDDLTRCARVQSAIPSAVIVQTATDAILALSEWPDRRWDLVSLDHDLGGAQMVDSHREDCGMEVARWIGSHRPQIAQLIVHSFNPVAGLTMHRQLTALGYHCAYLPFALDFYQQWGREQS